MNTLQRVKGTIWGTMAAKYKRARVAELSYTLANSWHIGIYCLHNNESKGRAGFFNSIYRKVKKKKKMVGLGNF
jgi:hypothetical protein